MGRFDGAIAPLNCALAADPNNGQARTLLGLSFYGARRFAEASSYLELVAKADPSNVQLQQMLAQSCLCAKSYSCALDLFRQIGEQNPESAPAHVRTGEALDGLRKTTEAIEEFQ